MNLWVVAVIELDTHSDHNRRPNYAPCAGPLTHPICLLMSLAMTPFGLSILVELRESRPNIKHQALAARYPWAITFPCRGDAARYYNCK